MRRGAAARRDRHAGHLRARAAARVRARLRGQSADRAALREVQEARRLPEHERGLRHVRRRRVRPRSLAAGLRPDQQAALDLRMFEAAARPRDPRLRPGAGARLHAVPPVQLDRSGARQPAHRQGGIEPRHHAVSRPHRARRADSARRRRAAAPLFHRRRRRHRRVDAHPRQRGWQRARKHLQHRQPRQRPLGARTRRDDAGRSGVAARIPRTRGAGSPDRHLVERVLRCRLPGRGAPRAENRQHEARPGLGRPGSRCSRRSAGSSTTTGINSTTRATSTIELHAHRPNEATLWPTSA